MRTSPLYLLCGLVVAGCERAEIDDPVEAPPEAIWAPPEECLDVRLPVILKTDRGRVPDYCFHRLDHQDSHVADPFDPLECSGELPDSEERKTSYISEEDGLRYSLEKYGCDDVECDFNAINNVMAFAEQYLWPVTVDSVGSYGRSPCGGEANCIDPLADKAQCFITVTDCSGDGEDGRGTLLRTYQLTCSGVEACRAVGKRPEDCCTITG